MIKRIGRNAEPFKMLRIMICAGFVLITLQACSPAFYKIERAHQIARSHVAPDVSLNFDAAADKLIEHDDGSYTVCGRAFVTQAPALDNHPERYTIRIKNDDGVAVFGEGGGECG